LALLFALLGTFGFGCSGGPSRLASPPGKAVPQVEKYLSTYGLTFDPAGRIVNDKGGRARTQWYCHRRRTDPRSGPSLDALFNRASPGPLPFEREAPLAEQLPDTVDCPWIFRVDVLVRPSTEAGESLLEPEEAWYKAQLGQCTPIGDPLVGQMRCQWSYHGASGPAEPAAWVRSILGGLGPFTRSANQETAVPSFSPAN
jgi:hypothetical protein